MRVPHAEAAAAAQLMGDEANRYPVKEVMGLLSEGFQPPMRDEIGDFDRNLWPDMAKEGYPLS
jgi:hypothetical protein